MLLLLLLLLLTTAIAVATRADITSTVATTVAFTCAFGQEQPAGGAGNVGDPSLDDAKQKASTSRYPIGCPIWFRMTRARHHDGVHGASWLCQDRGLT